MTTYITREQYAAQVAADMAEATLQTRVLEIAAELRWLAYHTHDSRRSQPGFPDLVLVSARSGRVMWRELKRQKEKPSAEQQEWLDALRAAGQDAGVWRPADLISGRVLAEFTARAGG